jgi:hypothetical protein
MFVLIGILLSSSCASRDGIPEKALPENAGYLISGLDENLNFAGNGMLIFDTGNFSKVKDVSLPKSKIDIANIAPDGNLWIGLSGGSTWDDDRVIVLDEAGNKLSEIHACLFPTAGIWFYKNKAIIVCRDTGFAGTIAEIDTSSFSVERKLVIKISDQRSFMMVSSGLSGSYMGVIGLTTGPQESLSYSVLSIVNLDTFSLSGMVELGAGTNIWGVLPYEGKFYLLNAQGKDDPKRQDILLVSPNDNKVEKTVTLQTPSPLWGVITNQVLYSFHNSGWNSILMSPERFLCSTNLITYQQECLTLPNEFDAFDIDVIGGNPCITHWGDNQDSGLYCLENGKLELKIKYDGASLIVLKN